MTVYLVVLRDRRTDPAFSIHRTRAGADARLEKHKAAYAPDYKWHAESGPTVTTGQACGSNQWS